MIIISAVVVHRQHVSYLAAQRDLEHPSWDQMILLPNSQYIVKDVSLLLEGVERDGGRKILAVVSVNLERHVYLPHRARQFLSMK